MEVFGTTVHPGQLIHADKHGFLAIPEEDFDGLLEAAVLLDDFENETYLAAARSSAGKSKQEILESINAAGQEFGRKVNAKYGRKGEWE